AQRVSPRTDCDLDYEEPFSKWMNEALGAIAGTQDPREVSGGPPATLVADVAAMNGLATPECEEAPRSAGESRALPTYSRSNPFPAPLLTNRRLNAPGSS